MKGRIAGRKNGNARRVYRNSGDSSGSPTNGAYQRHRVDTTQNRKLMGGTKPPTLIFVGVNAGQLLKQALNCSKHFVSHGFEIQRKYVDDLNEMHLGRNVWIHRIGMSNTTDYISVSGTGQTAGLYDQVLMAKYWRKRSYKSWLPSVETKKVYVTSLSKWTSEHNVSDVAYTSIDSEGHEVKIILGMQLEHEENRRKFAMFQFELGERGHLVTRDVLQMNGMKRKFSII